METLTASSMKALLENHRDKDRGFSCPTPKDNLLSKPEIRILGFQKHVNRGFSSLVVSVPTRKTVQPISSSRALSSSETSETSTGDEEMQQTVDATSTKTVHVKFQLHRECSFGQQFLIVGDDIMFGLWDPSNAVPLNWSEGHVWTFELDMPCDKMIKYKFILKGATDAILWQPGPDRILQTWETSKTITISEDWESAELQNITEEELVSDKLMESLEDSAAMIVIDNLPQPGGNPWNDMNTELNSRSAAYPKPTDTPLAGKPMAIVAENITEHNRELRVDVYGISREHIATDANDFVTAGADHCGNNALSINGEDFTLSQDEGNLDSGVGIPLLVPGLTPAVEDEEASVAELDVEIKSEASLGSNKADFSVPELNLDEESSGNSPVSQQENAMLLNDNQELQDNKGQAETTMLLNDNQELHHNKGQVEEHLERSQLVEHSNQQKGMVNNALENDLQWGRRTLQRFLTTLGLL